MTNSIKRSSRIGKLLESKIRWLAKFWSSKGDPWRPIYEMEGKKSEHVPPFISAVSPFRTLSSPFSIKLRWMKPQPLFKARQDIVYIRFELEIGSATEWVVDRGAGKGELLGEKIMSIVFLVCLQKCPDGSMEQRQVTFFLFTAIYGTFIKFCN